MIFFRKKKKEPEKPELNSAPVKKTEQALPSKPTKSFQEVIHQRILTAEGWRRQIEKEMTKKSK